MRNNQTLKMNHVLLHTWHCMTLCLFFLVVREILRRGVTWKLKCYQSVWETSVWRNCAVSKFLSVAVISWSLVSHLQELETSRITEASVKGRWENVHCAIHHLPFLEMFRCEDLLSCTGEYCWKYQCIF